MSNGSVGFRKFINMLAFFGIIAVAIALLLGLIFQGSEVAGAFNKVAQYIAYFVTAVYAFYFVYGKRDPVYTIIYVVCVITIIILLIV